MTARGNEFSGFTRKAVTVFKTVWKRVAFFQMAHTAEKRSAQSRLRNKLRKKLRPRARAATGEADFALCGLQRTNGSVEGVVVARGVPADNEHSN